MKTVRKCLAIAGLCALGIIGALLLVKMTRHRNLTGMCEKAGKGIDERLKESKAALDTAAAHIQSVFDHIKNRKP
jgi:hypothetical protein